MKKYIRLLILLPLLSFGCKKFIEVDLPKNQLVTGSVFSNDGHAIVALTNIYGQMLNKNTNYFLPLYTGFAGDELKNYSTNVPAIQMYQNAQQPIDAASNTFWNDSFNFIYMANAVWEGCEQSTALSYDVKKQLMAEARFIRAFWYFYLVNFYGDVPLLTTTDYKANAVAKRTATFDVYKQIIADLEYAASNLNAGYVDATTKQTYSERIRPNLFAAKALLARVYLYNHEWAKAEENASAVIGNTGLYDMVGIADPFLKNNKEAIWQMAQPDNGNLATVEGQYFILTAKPTFSLSNGSALSSQLLSGFTASDLRLTGWIGSYIDRSVTPNVTYSFPYKFKERDNSSYKEYSTPLRLAEQYLIRAEARAELNNIPGAKEDLNKIRSRAGLVNTPANTQSDLRGAILKERQLELFTEWGHRWLDLKRTGNIDAVMQLVTPFKGGAAWNSNKQWFPIPQKDIEANNNLQQNAGYN